MPEVKLPQPPKIEEVFSFPIPRVSAIAKFVAYPLIMGEDFFESMVRGVTGVEPPPGPVKTTINIMEGFETTIQATAPQLPKLPTPSAPTTPSVPPSPSTKTAQESKPTGKIDVEVF